MDWGSWRVSVGELIRVIPKDLRVKLSPDSSFLSYPRG